MDMDSEGDRKQQKENAEVRIRRAEPKDLGAIDQLLDQIDLIHHNGRPDLFKIGRKYDDDQLLALFTNENRPIYVAVDEEDRVMGYIFCIYVQHPADNVLTDIKTLYIDDFCVFENLRGQGIGKQLFRHAIKVARENGCYNVTLNVWSCNPAAKAFYEKCGMIPQKEEMEVILESWVEENGTE